jgi:hypothetical protein
MLSFGVMAVLVKETYQREKGNAQYVKKIINVQLIIMR